MIHTLSRGRQYSHQGVFGSNGLCDSSQPYLVQVFSTRGGADRIRYCYPCGLQPCTTVVEVQYSAVTKNDRTQGLQILVCHTTPNQEKRYDIQNVVMIVYRHLAAGMSRVVTHCGLMFSVVLWARNTASRPRRQVVKPSAMARFASNTRFQRIQHKKSLLTH